MRWLTRRECTRAPHRLRQRVLEPGRVRWLLGFVGSPEYCSCSLRVALEQHWFVAVVVAAAAVAVEWLQLVEEQEQVRL